MPSKKKDGHISARRDQSPANQSSQHSKSPTGPYKDIYPKLPTKSGESQTQTRSPEAWNEPQYRHSSSDDDLDFRSDSTLNETNMPEHYSSDWKSDQTDSSFESGPREHAGPRTRSATAYIVSPERRRQLRDPLSSSSFATPSSSPLPATLKKSSSKRHPGYHPVLPDPTKQNAIDQDQGINWLIAVLMFSLAVLICLYLRKADPRMEQAETFVSDVSERDEMVATFVAGLKDMKQAFPAQSPRFWATLAAASKSVLKTEKPRQPGIILLAGHNMSLSTVKCIERELSFVITSAYEDSKTAVRLQIGQKHLSIPQADLKLLIDDEFKSGLSTGSRVAVLQNLHDVPGKAAMMFHAYCDNESAPFKDAVILFTLNLEVADEVATDMNDNEIARAVEKQLQEKWEGEIGVDNAMALLSRVANNVAVVRRESAEILKKNNCL